MHLQHSELSLSGCPRAVLAAASVLHDRNYLEVFRPALLPPCPTTLPCLLARGLHYREGSVQRSGLTFRTRSRTGPPLPNAAEGPELRQSEPRRQNQHTGGARKPARAPFSLRWTISRIVCSAYRGLRRRKKRWGVASRSKTAQSCRKPQLRVREERKTLKADERTQ